MKIVPVQRTRSLWKLNGTEGTVDAPIQRVLTASTHSFPNVRTISATDVFADNSQNKDWIWFPSFEDLRTHKINDLGFLACSFLMMGVIIFCISGVTSLPAIYYHLTSTSTIIGAYWAPQLIGGVCFIISGALFTIETQKHVWLPAPDVLGWHVGAWNLVGGVGFTLCPIFGLLAIADARRHWAVYQAGCATFWGKIVNMSR